MLKEITMIHETIKLSEKYDATLTTYVASDTAELNKAPRRAIIVCPGGGYRFLSDRENEPIARFYMAKGLNTFVLRYSVKEGAQDYAPLIEAALAIKYVRENAEKYNIDPNYVFIIGFSAGGHLAASTGILWNIPEVRKALGDAPEGIGKPTGMILSYPVITAGPKAHKGSIYNLCGTTTPTKEEEDRFSLELHVDETTSPAFVWHTVNDKCVPVENTLYLLAALQEHKVPFEAHIYPNGVHGLSLGTEETAAGKEDKLNEHIQTWAELSYRWIMQF